jgi:hemoglobin-like flavoprotein
MRERKKTWEQKIQIVEASFERARREARFARQFYDNLFFLSPKLQDHFQNTDFEHQEKALMRGLEFLLQSLQADQKHAKQQITRIAHSHSASNMNIHPHSYYYWIEALIMTAREFDESWHKDMEYYWREVISAPVSFIVSQYFKG